MIHRPREHRTRRFRSLFALPLVLAPLTAAPAAGQLNPGLAGGDASPPPTAASLVKVSVMADVAAVRPGATFHLAVSFEIEPHWHIYWCDPGASGAPTEVSVTAPAGFTVGSTIFPRPSTFPDPAGLTYGYEREAMLFVPVTAPAQLAAETVSFDLDVFYFVCRDRCLIGQTKRTIELPVSRAGAATRPGSAQPAGARPAGARPEAARLARFKERLPQPLSTLTGGRASVVSAASGRGPTLLVLTGATRGFRDVAFFPIASPGVSYGAPETSIDGETFRISVPLEVKPRNALGQRMEARGLIALGRSSDQPSYDFAIPLDGSFRESER